jgi:hypothetical protein
MVEPYQPYAPLFTLKPVAADLWIVDGGTIRMSWLGLRIPFPTRMTLVRLRDGGLWLHSPVALTPELRAAVTRLGPVRYLVSPNKIHYWWIGSWREAFPEALACGLPEAASRARRRGVVFDRMLGPEPDPAWAPDLDQVLVPGAYLTEAVFLHRASRTAILADLIENFEPARIASPFWRLLVRLSGAADPDAQMPIDLRLTFLPRRREVQGAVECILAWRPERVILAHGRWYAGNGTAELARALRWTGARPPEAHRRA